MVGTGQDITELEETLRQHADRMEALEKLKSEFLLLASHELRGPLAVLRGYVALLQDGSLGPLPARAQSVLPTLANKGHEMNRLINEMLMTARMEEEGLDLRMEPADLRDLAAAAVRTMGDLAGSPHRLTTDLGDHPVPVMVDRDQIATVLVNLLDNAIKFSPAGGRVTCTVRTEDGRAIASVRDEGLGIEAAHQQRLFTRFGRLVTAENSHIPGTGLGLYLARELVRRHSGDIMVESEPGRGSIFSVTLPLGPHQSHRSTGNGHVAARAD
jgi:signal transduction histidine kinase